MSASLSKPSEYCARLPSGRCSFDDLAVIKAKAHKSGLSVSEYMRLACVHGKIEARPPKADIELIKNLQRIGVNLNQQTRALNARGRMVPERLEDVLAELETVLEGLRYGS